MHKPLLTLLLSALLTLPAAGMHAESKTCAATPARLWWGMIDPELSLLMACTGRTDTTQPVIWDWSWRAFWAALLHLPMTAEGA